MNTTPAYNDDAEPTNPEEEGRRLLDEMDWLNAIAWRGLEWGASMTRQQMDLLKDDSVPQQIREDKKNLLPDPWFFPHSVRYYAKMLLRMEAAERGEQLTLKDLANSGLEIRARHFVVKLLHANKGRVPPPGLSYVKQAFYKANSVIQGRLFGRATEHILLVWDHTLSGNIKCLDLVRPLDGGKTLDSVAYDVRVPVPHPAESFKSEPQSQVDEDDLDIRRADEGKGEEAT